MATALSNPLKRMIVIGEQAYKIIVSQESVRITRKGARIGAELKWDAILKLGSERASEPQPQQPRPTDLPPAIASDVAKEVRTALASLDRARGVLASAGGVPAALLMEVQPDPIYGRPEHETDWYIEPLLTADEVASILRVSRRAVNHMRIPSVEIQGERRYRQSELRRFIARHERPY